jgi:hypothetical protein
MSSIELLHGRLRRRYVANALPLHHINHHLADIGGMVGNTLKVFREEQYTNCSLTLRGSASYAITFRGKFAAVSCQQNHRADRLVRPARIFAYEVTVECRLQVSIPTCAVNPHMALGAPPVRRPRVRKCFGRVAGAFEIRRDADACHNEGRFVQQAGAAPSAWCSLHQPLHRDS